MPATKPSAAEAALKARYRETPFPDPLLSNQTIAAQLRHRSVRGFERRPLETGTLETLVAVAQSASTSSNKQAWSVIAVEDAGRRARLARIANNQAFIAAAPLFLVWIADWSRLTTLAQAAGRDVEAVDYTESFIIAVVDAALAAQNAAIAAESLGLGIVYVGALRNDPTAVAAELDLPQRAFAVFGMAIGHPAFGVASAVKPRLAPAAVLHRDFYSAEPQAEAVRRYDRHSLAFRAEQAMSPIAWTAQMFERLGVPGRLKGRETMRDSLRKLGFPLK